MAFTFIMSHASEFSAGRSPLISNLLSTLLTPVRFATASRASNLWGSLETVPVKVTTPFKERI